MIPDENGAESLGQEPNSQIEPAHADSDGDVEAATVRQAVLHRIEQARRELLDLTGRNRLLNTPRHRKRAKTIEIVDELCDEVYRILVSEAKAMAFLARSSEAPEIEDVEVASSLDPSQFALAQPSAEEGTIDDGVNRRHTDMRLQTSLDSMLLQKRLLGLHYDARTAMEEQGFNILFVAVGFLKWHDQLQPDKARYAPLLLIPITLDRTSARSRFRVQFSDEELITNLSLQAKLRSDFSIDLPDLPDQDDLVPSRYFREVAGVVEEMEGWEVLQHDMVLGIFSFSKLLMHRDMDSENWPLGRALADNPLLGKLLGAGFSEEPTFSDDVQVDEVTDPAHLPHVLDADSSQTLAIEEIRAGRNLVIQGPPGTGKSQTIANVIAAAISDNKTVLFVAEKRAALDVVKRRLDDIQLGTLCLEVHSHKARKKVVLEELDRTLALGRPTVAAGRISDDLRERRDRLNRHAGAIHSLIEPSAVTPFRALGVLVRLAGTGLAPPDFRLDDAAQWTGDDLHSRQSAIGDQARLLSEMGQPDQHQWRGVGVAAMLPTDVTRFMSEVARVQSLLAGWWRGAEELGGLLGLSLRTFAGVDQLVRLAEKIAAAPSMHRPALANSVWRDRRSDIDALLGFGETLRASRQAVTQVLIDQVWQEDLSGLRRALARHGGSIFRLLKAEYRAARSELRSFVRGKLPRSTEQIHLLDAVIRGQQALVSLRESDDLGRAAFGDHWEGERSRWSDLRAVSVWEKECTEMDLPEEFRIVAANLVDPNTASRIAGELKENIGEVQAQLSQIFDRLKLDLEIAFGGPQISDIEVPSILERLLSWRSEPGGIHEWITFRERDSYLRSEGLGDLSDRLLDGRVSSARAVDVLRYAYHEALLRRAWDADPELGSFDGKLHHRIVEEFRALEGQRMTLARGEVALTHYEGIPRGGAVGEVGLIRREIQKTRRHLPIRKLMSEAGNAIQKIKPVFMMSPMSVAQFLVPGKLEFDLLVIDEASQVRPVEALGAVARCRQMVVVGDKRQLPPTRFFDSLIEVDEDEEEEFHAGDLESILALCEVQGVHSKMLRWHYRSRHESLIAVSNRAFYEDRLFIIPSPLGGEHLGVGFKLVTGIYDRGGSRTNRVEAGAVADAVIQHAINRPDHTLGVGTFSTAQRDAILDEIELRRRDRAEVEPFFVETGAEPFFVKNLETIQGDERDVIFISVGYGKDESGYMAMNFGPLSNEGGERRLNVLISRARERMQVFSSIRVDDIDLGRTQAVGVRVLKQFLRYAETGVMDVGEVTGREPDSEFEEEVGRAVAALGHQVVHQVGSAGFFIDLAVVDPEQPGRYLLGIECDGASYHSSRSARDRDRLRQFVLESRGWHIHRIWSTDWFKDPEGQLRKVEEAVQRARIQGQAAQLGTSSQHRPPRSVDPDVLERGPPPEAPQGSVSGEAYSEANFSVPSHLALHEVKMSMLQEIVHGVISIEGPIHKDEVAQRVRSLWGLARAGRRIREHIERALRATLRAEIVTAEGEFYRVPDGEDAMPRDRSNVLSSTLLKAEMLPPSEIRSGLRLVVERHVGATPKEAIVETSRVFGFKRAGQDLKRVIQHEVRMMLRDDVLVLRDGKLYVADPREEESLSE